MRQKEQKLWDTFKRRCPRHINLLRVENMISAGTPDVHWVCGFCGWVELKSVTRPARATTRLMGNEGLNTDQINWHLAYHKFGGRSWVLVRDSAGEIYMVSGEHAATMNEWTASELRAHSAADDWPSVFAVLEGKT